MTLLGSLKKVLLTNFLANGGQMFGDSLGAFVKVTFQLKILLWLLLAIGSDSIKQVILLLIQLKPNT